MKAYYFDGDSGQTIVQKEIPEDMVEFCREKKLELLG